MKVFYLQFIDIEGPETLAMSLQEKGCSADIIKLYEGQSLPDGLDGINAVVCLGGPMNVYEEDKYPYLKEVDIFIKEVLKKKIPYLGLCLGSQLLAKASGGKVVKSPVEEIGWYKARLLDDPLFKDVDGLLDVFHWHGDMFAPSPDARLIATGDGCPNQAFRVGANAYGLQFHVEITRESIDNWSKAYSPDQEERCKEMLKVYDTIKTRYNEQAEKMYKNFYGIIEQFNHAKSSPSTN